MKTKYAIGPAVLVTAAFIGPGTITLCILSGINNGTSLLWVLVLSTMITIFIQNIVVRISHKNKLGLATSMLHQLHHPHSKIAFKIIVIGAIFGGNAAYEAGNISGFLIGLQGLFEIENSIFNNSFNWLSVLAGVGIAMILFFGNSSLFKKVLLIIVIVMSISFVCTAFIVKPSITQLVRGMFVPSFQLVDTLTIIGLVGTTIVPYNLFLHGALVSQMSETNLRYLIKDTYYAVGLGGIISICIIISASALEGMQLENAADLGHSLSPIFGDTSRLLLSFGFLAAGLSSALTAPIATAYVVCECLNVKATSKAYKITAISVLVVGVFFNSYGYVPLDIIRFAQIANGVILPIIGILIFVIINNRQVMQGQKASKIENLIFIFIILLFSVLSGKSLGILI